MKIGLLVTSVGNFGKKGFYNSQEVGLAKALEKYFDEVEICKLVTSEEEDKTELIPGTKHSMIHFVPAPNFGINGIIDCSVLNKELDGLIYFADTQLCVPRVYQWCKKNQVKFFPYIGTVESHSTSKLKKIVIDTLFSRNLRVFKKSHCFCKTPQVEGQLHTLGIKKTSVVPVGLDVDLLKKDYDAYDTAVLKAKYGYVSEEKVLVFIGRFIEEKQPLNAVTLIQKLWENDHQYRLLMVGSGPLENEILDAIHKNGLSDKVKIINSIPNTEIWELYRFAEAFLNLNCQEILAWRFLKPCIMDVKLLRIKRRDHPLSLNIKEADFYVRMRVS